MMLQANQGQIFTQDDQNKILELE